MAYPQLAITDGTTRINLLATTTGLHLADWNPLPPAAKSGGVWQDGGLSDGRRLAVKRWANITDTFVVAANGLSQNELIYVLQELRRLLEKATTYWTTEWQTAPVWLEAVAGCETNTRYALIYDYQVGGEANPYAPPFAPGPTVSIAALMVTLEHGLWQSQPPGQGECVKTAITQTGYEIAGWASNSALMAGFLPTAFRTATGRLLVSSVTDKKVWRTDDDGATAWGSSAALATGISDIAQDAAGTLYGASINATYKSVDNGATWAATANALNPTRLFWRKQDGYLYQLNTNGSLYRSTDGAATWALVAGAPVIGSYPAFCLDSNGVFYCCKFGGIFYRSLDGVTWNAVANTGYFIYQMYAPGDGYLYALASAVGLLRSTDGVNWTMVATAPFTGGVPYAMVYSSLGVLYASYPPTAGVYASLAGGQSWRLVTTTGAATYMPLVESNTSRRMLVGIAAGVWAQGLVITATLGQPATCASETFLANTTHPAQLTHIFQYDAAPVTWTPILPAGGFPVSLFPAVPAAGDSLYFGMAGNAPNFGPFTNLVFNLATLFAADPLLVWEYSQGAGVWDTLTATDATYSFRSPGVNSVHWVPPALWATDTVNGVAGLWVRARIGVGGGGAASPTQVTRNIYTANSSSPAISATDVLGDLPALLRAWLTNRVDSASISAWANRYVIGLRSTARGATFAAFLNFSSTQQPLGLAVAGTVATVSAANIQTATGKQYTHTGTGTATWADQFTFTFSGTLAAAYYGRFRAFLRAQQAAGSAGDVRVRLKVQYGTGGNAFTSDYAVFAGVSNWQLLDLGSFLFPPASAMNTGDVGDSMVLTLQIWSSAARVVNLYDLALIPSDEWSADLVDPTTGGSTSGVGGGYLLDLDSVSFTQETKRALVRQTGPYNAPIKAIYTPIAAGPAVLQANAAQSLHVLCARYAAGVWYSEPWLVHSIRLQAAFRYLSMRGSR